MQTNQTSINILSWDCIRPHHEQSISKESLSVISGEVNTFYVPGVHLDNHWTRHGFVSTNDYSVDLQGWYGLEIEAELFRTEPIELTVEIGLLCDCGAMPEQVEYVQYRSVIIKSQARISKVVIPFNEFNDLKVLAGKWRAVRSVRLLAVCQRQIDELSTDVCMMIHKLQAKRSRAIHVAAPVRSRSADIGQSVQYELILSNCTEEVQTIKLVQQRYGWETMNVCIEPTYLLLQQGACGKVSVTVELPDRIPAGGYEVQKITIIPGNRGDLTEAVEFTTSRMLTHPYIKLVESEWLNVQSNIHNHAWAAQLFELYMQRAQQWMLPLPGEGTFIYESYHAHEAENAAIAWKLTGENELATKLIAFLRGVIDPEFGYPRTRQACHQELVHEGEFFKHVAVVYDLLFDSGLLSAEDHRHVEHTFRLFIDLIDWALSVGGISNWTLAELVGALYCSQALQDRERMNRFLYDIGGYVDHLAKGTLDDGWWYECSVGYNLMAAGLFSEITQSCRPWGINLATMWVPAQYNSQVMPGNQSVKDGLSTKIWGPARLNYRSINQLWDSLLPFADYRGVLFGINDSAETKLPGISPRGYMDARYDLAYYLFRKPEYADILLNCDLADRDLLYAMPELQPSNSKPYLGSHHADNSGLAVLRSQTEGREAKDQIQAVVKYGSHGGAHGHYDRVSLLSLMRYGRSFYNPENIWYNYHTFMYKFYVQTSLTHNMVVVDYKQQDPAEGTLRLFHSGTVFQACIVDNEARWSYPPYGGWQVEGEATFKERAWNEGRYVSIPEDVPPYSQRTGFTEPIFQRRLTVVTDDYVVLFDYVSGNEEHDYDNLFHCKGLDSIHSEALDWVGRTDQLDTDSLGSAQFVTECDWYRASRPVKAKFKMEFGEDYDQHRNRTYHNEKGSLCIDHHTVWPPQFDWIIGNDPEYWEVDKKLYYQIRGDQHILAQGQFGAWLLGRDDLDISIEGIHQLELIVHVEAGKGEHGRDKSFANTIFWGDPYVIDENGEKWHLTDLPWLTENTNSGHGIGIDYYGGPVKLAAQLFPRAVPAEPENRELEGIIRVDLSTIKATRLIASIGGDYPLGDESSRRKLVSARTRGKSARFITVIEPYENQSVITSISAQSADRIQIELTDGRNQTISVHSLEEREDNSTLQIELIETTAQGTLIRTESTDQSKTQGAI